MSTADPTSEDTAYDSEARKLFPRNYWANIIEGGVYIGGMKFLAAETVISPMIKDLGGSDLLIAWVPMFTLIGVVTMPLLMAHRVQRMPRLMPFLRITGVVQRAPYLIAGLALYFLAERYPLVVLTIVALTPLVCGIAMGYSFSAWMEILGRLIPKGRRASMFASRNILTALIGLGAGWGVREILKGAPGSEGYAYLHLVAFGFILVSYIVFCMIKEPDNHHAETHQSRGLGENLRDLPKILAADRRFLLYCICRMFHYGVFVMVPFLSLHALKVTGRPKSFLGNLIMVSMFGGLVGNLFAALSGDRHGGKHLQILARVLFIVVCATAALTTHVWGFYAVYFLYGAGINLDRVGAGTLSLEISPENRRPTYISLVAIACLPGMLAAPMLSWAVKRWAGEFPPAAVLSGVATILSLIFLLFVKEPRRRAAK